jgi:hypothetical protein
MGRKRGVQYRLGSFFRTDDRSGFVQRAEKTKQEWNQLIVDRSLWEPRQPQDFVKGVADDQSVPQSRSEAPSLYQGPLNFTLAAAAGVGATFLNLGTSAGIKPGGTIGVMLDTGSYFNTTVSGAPLANGVNISNPLPGSAAEGNVVTAYEAPGP